jgi:hypothetical protein
MNEQADSCQGRRGAVQHRPRKPHGSARVSAKRHPPARVHGKRRVRGAFEALSEEGADGACARGGCMRAVAHDETCGPSDARVAVIYARCASEDQHGRT